MRYQPKSPGIGVNAHRQCRYHPAFDLRSRYHRLAQRDHALGVPQFTQTSVRVPQVRRGALEVPTQKRAVEVVVPALTFG